MKRHGGSRLGSGRPRKWDFSDIQRIGQACEACWLNASEQAVLERIAALPYEDKIRRLHEDARKIPQPDRTKWLQSEHYDDHREDLEAILHARAGTPFDEDSGTYEVDAPRMQRVSSKPPRGTRERIIAEIAKRFGLSESQVDNLWQSFRRFEKEAQDSAES